MKQQRMNNEAMGAASGTGLSDGNASGAPSGRQPSNSNVSQLSLNIAGSILDDINKKKGGRKVVDWTSSCALYLEVHPLH